MVTYKKLFSDGGHFVGYAVYINGKHFENCDTQDLHKVLREAENIVT